MTIETLFSFYCFIPFPLMHLLESIADDYPSTLVTVTGAVPVACSPATTPVRDNATTTTKRQSKPATTRQLCRYAKLFRANTLMIANNSIRKWTAQMQLAPERQPAGLNASRTRSVASSKAASPRRSPTAHVRICSFILLLPVLLPLQSSP